MPSSPVEPPTIRWTADRAGVVILDQTELPARCLERELRDVAAIEEAIQSLRVRGAPLIGITASMGLAALARGALGQAAGDPDPGPSELAERVERWAARLAEARPTAVNLRWALRRMTEISRAFSDDSAEELASRLADEADAIRREDEAMCRRIGEHAVALLEEGGTVVTHCNAGALATAGIGTALAPIYVAKERGIPVHVYADETRPLLQGSRLTAWELARAGIEVTVISDGMAGALMASETPDLVFVGADRIVANGDAANKIGTYGLAVLARHHGVPFYVLAPTSTVDLATPTGEEIPIEHRSGEEVRRGFGTLTAPPDSQVWSPAFDVTPASLIAGIVTEQAVHRPPYVESLAAAVRAAESERVGR